MKSALRMLLLVQTSVFLLCTATGAASETLSFGRFGGVALYRPAGPVTGVALFLSGDGGWNKGVVDMAREIQGMGVAVAGIDVTRYLRNLETGDDRCSYPAADLEALSKIIQKQLGLPRYHVPVLVGYSSGASLVYAVLVQAPPNTFAGAISLGFCPDLPLVRPLCRGNGLEWQPGKGGKGVVFLPAKAVRDPWTVLHGTIDQVCSIDEVREFIKNISGADLVELPKVGHGFSVPRNWLPEFKQAFEHVQDRRGRTDAALPDASLGLPVVEVAPQGPDRDLLAVILSGDGGWAGIDREIGTDLAKHGVPVAGLNSLQYFWTARSPVTTAGDVARLLRHYLRVWNKRQAVLIGYSFGADVLPFVVNRLPQDLRERIVLVVLIGPGNDASFEFHVSDWLGGQPARSPFPLLPELARMHGPALCLYGEEETGSICRHAPAPAGNIRPVQLPGGHHFGGHYMMISDRILEEIEQK